MWSKLRAHHMVALVSILVGLDFLFENFSLRSPALAGPVSLADVLGLPFASVHIWGALFLIGGLSILLAWKPMLRALFLICGVGSWTIFAASSLYESWFGADAENTGSIAGILFVFVVATFLLALRNLMVDFKSKKQ